MISIGRFPFGLPNQVVQPLDGWGGSNGDPCEWCALARWGNTWRNRAHWGGNARAWGFLNIDLGGRGADQPRTAIHASWQHVSHFHAWEWSRLKLLIARTSRFCRSWSVCFSAMQGLPRLFLASAREAQSAWEARVYVNLQWCDGHDSDILD